MSSSMFLKKLKPPGFPDFPVGKGRGLGKWRGALLFFSTFLLITSCGIIQYHYIFPAYNDWQIDPNNPQFTFDHDPRNKDTVFEGYMLFYRFFSFAKYEQHTHDFIDYLISLEADLDSTAIKNPDSYREKGYRRVYMYPSEFVAEITENDEPPYHQLVIEEELRGEPLSFTIDFVEVVNNYENIVYPELSCDFLETKYSLFRYEEADPTLGASTLSYLSFSPGDIEQGQEDLPQDDIFEDPFIEGSFYLSLFVVPYGIDANFIPYYGEARTLGYISLRFR